MWIIIFIQNFSTTLFLSHKNFRNLDTNDWQSITTEIINTIYNIYNNVDDNMKKKLNCYIKSIVEQQFNFALGKSNVKLFENQLHHY